MLRLVARVPVWARHGAALVVLHALHVAAADSSADYADMTEDYSGQLSTSATTYRERIRDSDVSELIAAIQRAHSHRASGRAVELELSGRYQLDQPLNLAAPGSTHAGVLPTLTLVGPAVLDGGVPVSDWKVDATRPWLFRARVPAALLPISSDQPIVQMWDGDTRIPVARTATMHYNASGPINPTTHLADSIVTQPGQVSARFKQLSSMRMFKYHSWDISYYRVASIRPSAADQSMLQITTKNKIQTRWDLGGLTGASGQRFYLEGVEEFLHPGSGTFVHDAASNELLYAPRVLPSGTGKFTTTVPRISQLILTNGGSDISLEGLTFEHSASSFKSCYSLNSYCEAQSASDQEVATLHWIHTHRVQLFNVTVRHTGGYAVWFDLGTVDSAAVRVHLTDLGAGGVRIGSDSGSAHNITVSDSVIEDGGHVWRQGAGVLHQVANHSTISYNIVRRFYNIGIALGWSWGYAPTLNTHSVVRKNHISTLGQGELSDMGCVYHLGVDIGTLIEDNLCHNVTAYDYGGFGYYLDEGSSYVTVRGNVAYNTKAAGVFQHYGQHNTIENNILWHVDLSIGPHNVSQAAIGSGAHDEGDFKDLASFTFQRNVVSVDHGQMFSASTLNGFRNMSFDHNVYFNSGGRSEVLFPCDPDDPYAGSSWVSQGCLSAADPRQYIQSPNGRVKAAFNKSTGQFCVSQGDAVEWCGPSAAPASINVSAIHACMQGDGNFCVDEWPDGVAGKDQKVLFCSLCPPRAPGVPCNTLPKGNYWAVVGDDCSFCVFGGPGKQWPSSSTAPPPPLEAAHWCGSRGPCKNAQTEMVAHVANLKQAQVRLQFPTDCTLAAWQRIGRDLHSVVGDPQINSPATGDWRLRPSSPALTLGFKQVNVTDVGPRAVKAREMTDEDLDSYLG